MNERDPFGVHEQMDRSAVAAVRVPLEFEDFFEAERRRLMRALVLLTGNAEEAEEAMQDAFLALWERWDRVAAMEDPTGYLYRTAMNRHRSRMRRAVRAARRAVGQAQGGDLFADVDERDAIARALARLSTRRREAIVLTELLGFGSPEAGRAMGVSEVTVRRLVQDARDQLRRALTEANEDE
jgi:RNA polymerase sigma-70 factor (ECF subfamily)